MEVRTLATGLLPVFGPSFLTMRCWSFFFLSFLAFSSWLGALSPLCGAAFQPSELVRLTKSETLLFKGENFLGAPKGQEFSVLKHDTAQGLVFVSFFKEDGTLIAVTLPAEAVVISPPDPWSDLLRGVEAFRDQRFEDARRLLARAAADPTYRTIAPALSTRVNSALLAATSARSNDSARGGFANVLQGLRDTAVQLEKLGHLCLALPLDEGVERLGASVPGAVVPPTKLNRDEITKLVTISNRAAWRTRQALALHRVIEASKIVNDGLLAEPGRPDLKALQARVTKDLTDAEDDFKAADRMRKFAGGAVHALSALEHGLKRATDHPKLRALKKEMEGAMEERTSPQITPAFLAAAKVSTPPAALEEGRKLYTSRCTECHDLEMVDSRSIGGWRSIVGSMSRRAHVDDAQQARIIDYLAAAANGMDAAKGQ